MLQYVKIDGKEYPFLYSLSASVEAEGVDIEKLGFLEQTKKYLYLGFKYGSKFEEKDFPHDEKEFSKLMELNPDVFRKASEVFEAQMGKILGGAVVKKKTPQ